MGIQAAKTHLRNCKTTGHKHTHQTWCSRARYRFLWRAEMVNRLSMRRWRENPTFDAVPNIETCAMLHDPTPLVSSKKTAHHFPGRQSELRSALCVIPSPHRRLACSSDWSYGSLSTPLISDMQEISLLPFVSHIGSFLLFSMIAKPKLCPGPRPCLLLCNLRI